MKVYQAIGKVMADLVKVGISKADTNTYDNYKFRGIDAVYNALSPLLAKHGLCFLPRVKSCLITERQAKDGKAMFHSRVDMEFDLVCAEDGSKHTVAVVGEALDRGDKSVNKSMSAAFKYAAFQTFCIPTEGDNDADSSTHELMSEEEKRQIALDEALEANKECIDFIKVNLSAGKLKEAADAWFELSDATKQALWVAPTKYKNAPFTTLERTTMKSDVFRKAHYGEGVAAEMA